MKSPWLWGLVAPVAMGVWIFLRPSAPAPPPPPATLTDVLPTPVAPPPAPAATAPATNLDLIADFSADRPGQFYFRRDGKQLSVWRQMPGAPATELVRRAILASDLDAPVALFWIDLNGDRRKDLFVVAGPPEARRAQVYLQEWRGETLELRPAFEESDAVGDAVVLYFEEQPGPAILTGGPAAGAPDPCRDMPLAAISAEMEAGYLLKARELATQNAPAPSPAARAAQLRLFEPYRILRGEGNRFADATRDYPKFADWRARLRRKLGCKSPPPD